VNPAHIGGGWIRGWLSGGSAESAWPPERQASHSERVNMGGGKAHSVGLEHVGEKLQKWVHQECRSYVIPADACLVGSAPHNSQKLR
jgi:hypothetical protein